MKAGKIMKRLNCILSIILVLCMVTVSPLSMVSVKASSKTVAIDLSNTKGEMIPKTGGLLIPNEDIPDGRIVARNHKNIL